MIESPGDRELGRIAFSVATLNEYLELAVDAVARIEHVSPEVDRKTGSPAMSRAGSCHQRLRLTGWPPLVEPSKRASAVL
ncbi:hypothetical protein D3C87_1879470 [compost metagenome]